jgi:phytoene dehydrogenase-like protein
MYKTLTSAQRSHPVTSERTDVVVIGGGHNGLVAAAYLARANLSVVVLEALDAPGGMARSERPIAAAPHHAVDPCAVDLVFMHASTVIADLGLMDAGLRLVDVDPTYAYLDPEGASIAFWKDAQRTAQEIGHFSAADADTYLQMVRDLDVFLRIGLPLLNTNPVRPSASALRRAATQAARGARSLPHAGALFSRSPLETLEGRFRHPIVRDALASLVASGGDLAKRGNGAGFLFLAFLHRFGVTRPLGGMQSLATALVRRVTEAGGQVRTGVQVEQILTSDGRTTGVCLASEQELHARLGVVSTLHPQVTLGTLLPTGQLPPRVTARLAAIPSNAAGTGDLKLDVALNSRLDLSRHEKRRADGIDLRMPCVMVGQLSDMGEARARAEAGEMPGTLPFWAFVGTAADPSQAPQNQDVLSVWTPFVPARPALGETAYKELAGNALFDAASTVFEGLAAQEIGRHVATSADICAKYQVPNGCIVHVDLVPSRMGPLRPARGLAGYRTPVGGLYLGGNGTHPGIGVCGISGQLAARELLRSTGEEYRRHRPALLVDRPQGGDRHDDQPDEERRGR